MTLLTSKKQSLAALITFMFLLPSCQQKKRYALPAKTQAWSNPLSTQEYRRKKEDIAYKQQLKQQMRHELPNLLKDMTLEQVRKAIDYYTKLEYNEQLIKGLERLITITDDQQEAQKVRLRVADLYFEQGEFEKAGKLYVLFLEYYPGSDQRDYVEYKAILCRFYMTLNADRDQTKTYETVALTQKYLSRVSDASLYIHDVQDIQHNCYVTLADADINISQFYMRRGKYAAAQERLDHVKQHFLASLAQYEPKILELEITLALEQGQVDIAQQKSTELVRRFPASTSGRSQVVMAQGTPKTDYVTKF